MTVVPWLADAFRRLALALDGDRQHPALLVAGPPGTGKRDFARAFAAAALCHERAGDAPACGHCRDCTLLAAGTHPDFARVTLEEREPGKLRTEITVEQVRALCARLALASQFGGWQVAVIDPADKMNASAANALLKTLEEPSAPSLIVLVSDDPSRLPATIRSRCQRIDAVAPPEAVALDWLVAAGLDRESARSALAASAGNPGLALQWSRDGTAALDEICRSELASLAEGRNSAMQVAEGWAADRPRERLWFACVEAAGKARRLASTQSQRDALTAATEIQKLTAWFAAATRARRLLDTTVRADLVLLDVMRQWPRQGST